MDKTIAEEYKRFIIDNYRRIGKMASDLKNHLEQSSICLHKLCIDCPLLPMCTLDSNDYDPEKVKKYLESIHCPQCGFVLFQTTDGRDVCIVCQDQGGQ